MTDTEKAIQEIEDSVYHESLKSNISMSAKAVALVALQEKLARDSGCGYCQSSKVIYPKFGGDPFYLEVDGGEITVWDGDACVAGFSVRHCPVCGRKIGCGGHE